MKQLLFLFFAICFATAHAQSCTRITFKMVAEGFSEEGFLETTVCVDKSVTVVKNGPLSSRYIVNPAEKASIMLMENGAGDKMAFVTPIISGETKRSKSKFRDEDFHFTGEMKMIAGYNCEKFTIENEKGVKCAGYLSRELKIDAGSAENIMLQTSLGTVMEDTATTELGIVTITAIRSKPFRLKTERNSFRPKSLKDMRT